MSRTTYYTATTLDGYIADEHDSLDWLMSQDIDPKGPMNYDAFIADIGAMVMGRTTYEWVLAHNARTGSPWQYTQPTWVVTHADLPAPEGADVRFAQGDVPSIHAALVDAADGKDVWVVGGGDLAGQFADAGLLNRIVVSIAPVTLGAGRPLFPRRYDMALVDIGRNRAFVCATYDMLRPRP